MIRFAGSSSLSCLLLLIAVGVVSGCGDESADTLGGGSSRVITGHVYLDGEAVEVEMTGSFRVSLPAPQESSHSRHLGLNRVDSFDGEEPQMVDVSMPFSHEEMLTFFEGGEVSLSTPGTIVLEGTTGPADFIRVQRLSVSRTAGGGSIIEGFDEVDTLLFEVEGRVGVHCSEEVQTSLDAVADADVAVAITEEPGVVSTLLEGEQSPACRALYEEIGYL